MPTTKDILGVIMGGGRGTRLYPLTRDRAKPAVPIGGKYRLIDIPISNCINAGITRVAVLTQYNSVSLHRHISQSYNFDAFSGGWVQIWAAEQRVESEAWYQGTADAVRKQILEIQTTGAKYVLILAGDHLYRMDYDYMAEFHWEREAEITVAVQPVYRETASRFGLLKVDEKDHISDFVEKPKDDKVLKEFESRDDERRPHIGSMGIYLFNTDVLVDLLNTTTMDDFGKELIPHAIQTKKVFGYPFDGYWEDIGTIRSFYETNLSLTRPDPSFNFYHPTDPIYTHARFLPGSIVEDSTLHNVLLADGSQIRQAVIEDSIIGLRGRVFAGSKVRFTVMMGADYFDTEEMRLAHGGVTLGIGPNCDIEGAILDKNARLAEGVTIRPFPLGTNFEEDDCVVRDGVVVIPKNTVLKAGRYIGPG